MLWHESSQNKWHRSDSMQASFNKHCERSFGLRKKEAGKLLKCSSFFYTYKMDYNETLHTPSPESFFYDTAYIVPNRCIAMPVNGGQCVENDIVFVGPKHKLIGWKCNDKSKALSKAEKRMIDGLCLKFKRSINVIRNELDNMTLCVLTVITKGPDNNCWGTRCPEGCFSVLRAVKSAAVHYPGARSLLRQLYKAIRINKTLTKVCQRVIMNFFWTFWAWNPKITPLYLSNVKTSAFNQTAWQTWSNSWWYNERLKERPRKCLL